MKQFFFTVLTLTSISLIGLSQANRVILVEEGTGTGCQWCPRGDVFAKNMLKAYPKGKIAYVAVHGYNEADPMFNENYRDKLADLGINAFPSGMANRSKMLNYENPLGAGSEVDDLISIDPPANVVVETSFDEVSRQLALSLTAEMFEDLTGEYRFSAIIIENAVFGPAPAYDQSNAYAWGNNGPMGGYENLPNPVPADFMVYNHVGRHILGAFNGIEGSLPSELKKGESYSFQIEWQVPVEYRTEYIQVIGVIIDQSNGEILNAGMSSYLDGSDNAKPFFHSEGKMAGFTSSLYEYNIVSHDPDFDDLELSLTEKPDWLNLEDHGNGFGKLSGVPGSTGEFTVNLQLSDGIWKVDQSFVITVKEALEDWVQLGLAAFNKYTSHENAIKKDAEGNLYAYSASLEHDIAEVYRLVNDEWIQLGPDLALEKASQTSLAVSPEGIPHIADGASVYRLANDSWEKMGSSFLSGGTILYPSMVFDQNGELYICASLSSSSGVPNYCFKWTGNDWLQLGSEVNDVGVWNKLLLNEDSYPILAYGGGGPYSFYTQVSAFNGSEWILVGGNALNTSKETRWILDITQSTDGISYCINGTGEDRVVDLYELRDGEWIYHTAGLATGVADFSASINTDTEGNVYFAYNDVLAGGGVSVKKFDGNNWRNLGLQGFTTNAKKIKIILDQDNIPVVLYTDILNGGLLSAKKYRDLSTSVQKPVQSLDDITLYPNPNKGDFFLEYVKGGHIQIFDLNANIIYDQKIDDPDKQMIKRHRIDITTKAGLYFLKIIRGNNSRLIPLFID